MIRDGEGIVAVAKILGHSIETARGYSLPTDIASDTPPNESPSTGTTRTVRAWATAAPSRTNSTRTTGNARGTLFDQARVRGAA
jgi:hypothetical protein